MKPVRTAHTHPVVAAYILLTPAIAVGAGPWEAFRDGSPASPFFAVLQDQDASEEAASGVSPADDAHQADGTGRPGAAGVTGAASEQQDAPPSEPWLEKENTTYRFVGARARMVVIPSFMFDLVQADGGSTVVAPMVGVEYASRQDEFESVIWLAYASWGMDDSPFKGKSDPDAAYEIVRSELKTLSVGADFTWSTQLHNGLSFTYGGGGGLGIVFGSLYRQQAYPPGVPGDPETYVPCPGPGAGNSEYCANDNDHYGDYTEPTWFDGGSKPVIFPWIALPQLGLRWKASGDLALRFDTGLSFPGPLFFGLSGQYGLK